MEVEQTMATGRIRRTAQRGIAAAVLGWLGVAAFSVVGAPAATAAPAVTIEIRNLTPPAASVDPGGTVTFVNKIPSANKGGISIPLVGSLSATIYTDVAVTFFNQEKKLQPEQSAAWAFSAPATTGTITYTYRIVPQAGLAVAVANQVVSKVASTLPPLPAPTPYVVQTIAPGVPNLPSIGLPPLPQVNVQVPALPGTPTPGGPDGSPTDLPPGAPTAQGANPPAGTPGDQYAYQTGPGGPPLSPSAVAAAKAFDPTRWSASGNGSGGSGSGAGGSGGVPGGYDGATVPVFGELAGLDSAALDADGNPATATASSAKETLPAAALAAVVALAAVTAALVRTHQANRATK
jgi:hypothetical protein